MFGMCSRLAANTEEKQPAEERPPTSVISENSGKEKQLTGIVDETTGKSFLKGDTRLKKRSH